MLYYLNTEYYFLEVIFIKRYTPYRCALNFLRIVTALVALAASILSVIYLDRFPILMYIVTGVFCFTAFALDFILYPLYFSKTSFCVSKDFITKKSGMLFTKKQLMKKSSVQYLSVVKTPLSGFTGMNFVIICALGGKIILSFLSREDVDEISEMLRQGGV